MCQLLLSHQRPYIGSIKLILSSYKGLVFFIKYSNMGRKSSVLAVLLVLIIMYFLLFYMTFK